MIEDTIDDLNKLLEFELGARDAYAQNLSSSKEKTFIKVIEENHESHRERVHTLQDAIKKLNGNEAASSKVWGNFGKVMGGTTAVMNDRATIEALVKGEDELLTEYKTMLEKRGNSAILSKLMEKQEETKFRVDEVNKSK